MFNCWFPRDLPFRLFGNKVPRFHYKLSRQTHTTIYIWMKKSFNNRVLKRDNIYTYISRTQTPSAHSRRLLKYWQWRSRNLVALLWLWFNIEKKYKKYAGIPFPWLNEYLNCNILVYILFGRRTEMESDRKRPSNSILFVSSFFQDVFPRRRKRKRL